jgi:hypothetical protein
LIGSLHESFGLNISNLPADAITHIESIDLNCRAIDGIRGELLERHCGSDCHKRACACLLEEIFSNFALAMYLFSIGLIVPARMLIRRALELGIASVYMWDLPHEYWGWTKHDEDLSFTKMVSHLASDSYLTYLANINEGPKDTSNTKHASTTLHRIYRTLSDTVHGKTNNLPALSPERYSPGANQLSGHLQLTTNVQNILISIWCDRFSGLYEYLEIHYPRRATQQ